MITVAEALSRIARFEPLGTEEVPVAQAGGRVLAREIRADCDWPPFETSAMDGYAVRLEDVSSPGALLAERALSVAAGDPPPPPIATGEAVRVMTGAAIPENTEAVIPVEQSRREQGRVRFETVPAPGAHLRRRGESIAAGKSLVLPGRRLTPTDVALAAMAGADPVTVFRMPRIAIAATGNELVAAGRRPGPGQLRDSNGPMLASLCRERGWRARLESRVADDAAGVDRLFARAGSAEDLLLTTGGVSAGDFDLLPAAAERAGFEILFHGVSLRPGKPVALGRRGAALWLGLPGNPVSTAVCFHLFGREVAGRLEGDSCPAPPRVTARLSRPLPAAGPRETYRDARWEIVDGESRVEPLRSAGSHDIGAHSGANAFIRIPAGSPPLEAGAGVECLLIGEVGRR
ncbi:MAG: gephyrin-like molybdotransferase Glp [Acidobacteriota bacterium]